MIRETRFLISRTPYAIDPASLRVGDTNPNTGNTWAMINAVWFRRRPDNTGPKRRTITVACVGTLRDLQDQTPRTAEEFLTAFVDGRYGGHCDGRWNGNGYWGAHEPTVIEEHLTLLRPMLDNYPTIPAGFDGWWRF
ncbi:hypothetical protein AB0G71_12495 [Streptomyces sp. NPDC020403]|uniref:hypothetical protein n=1 Tax=unclassified Streptomyces TaxID=2593676 RepID=UPI00340D4A81